MPTKKSPTSAPVQTSLYHYRARVTAVHDGDTCTVDIDLGLSSWIHGEKVRFHRINAPELSGASHVRGAAARDYLTKLILGKDIILQTIKDEKEKYGRYLGEVWLERPDAAPMNINDELVRAKHAKYKSY